MSDAKTQKKKEEGCYMGHTSDYVATEPWMYGKEDPCAGPGWRERTARKGQNPTPQASAEGTVGKEGTTGNAPHPKSMPHRQEGFHQ
jgi:hypothetical protein